MRQLYDGVQPREVVHSAHAAQRVERAVGERYLARDPEAEMRKAFALFDESGSGRITLANMRRVAKELGEALSEEEMEAMIAEFAQDGATISEEEFVAIMRQTALY